MDVAYNQHSPFQRHHSHSHTNLNHLTLAPLTSRLPLSDPDDLPQSSNYSYIEGRSAPSTPSILSRSSSRVSTRKPVNLDLPKSKSSTHLLAARKQPWSGATTPNGPKLRKAIARDELSLSSLSGNNRNDSDWLLRAGAAIATSARESKGQTWLVSRASSTSLTGQRDEEEEIERDYVREREQASRRASRRGSMIGDADDEFSPVTTRRSLSFGPIAGPGSRAESRPISRYGSRRGSRASLFTPMNEREGYFDRRDFPHEELPTEPDFVEVEEESETEDEAKQDEAMVRKLARASGLGLAGWVERMLGWDLFAVEEDGEENTENEFADERAEESGMSSRPSRHTLDGADTPKTEIMPPLRDEDAGGWQDATWLLSVATKVLL